VSSAGQNLREIVRALCVLTLVFLNFGHTPTFQVAYSADLTPYVMSEQGYADLCRQTGQEGPQDHHVPCHACRIGSGADLPPMPCLAALAFLAAKPVAYVAPLQTILSKPFPRTLGSRAPPSV
jgi:hypothetical protein